jgi:hypothetical protein
MSQSLWESEVVVDQQLEQVEQPEPPPLPEQQPVPEPHPERPAKKEAAEPEVLALSAGDFSALEERVQRTVNLVKQERQARTEAEERAAKAEAKLLEQMPLVDRLQSEVKTLRSERDLVLQRVERLLAQLDVLEL